VTARRAVETSDAADTMMQLRMKKKKKKFIAQQFCPAVQLMPLRQTVIPTGDCLFCRAAIALYLISIFLRLIRRVLVAS